MSPARKPPRAPGFLADTQYLLMLYIRSPHGICWSCFCCRPVILSKNRPEKTKNTNKEVGEERKSDIAVVVCFRPILQGAARVVRINNCRVGKDVARSQLGRAVGNRNKKKKRKKQHKSGFVNQANPQLLHLARCSPKVLECSWKAARETSPSIQVTRVSSGRKLCTTQTPAGSTDQHKPHHHPRELPQPPRWLKSSNTSPFQTSCSFAFSHHSLSIPESDESLRGPKNPILISEARLFFGEGSCPCLRQRCQYFKKITPPVQRRAEHTGQRSYLLNSGGNPAEPSLFN